MPPLPPLFPGGGGPPLVVISLCRVENENNKKRLEQFYSWSSKKILSFPLQLCHWPKVFTLKISFVTKKSVFYYFYLPPPTYIKFLKLENGSNEDTFFCCCGEPEVAAAIVSNKPVPPLLISI